MKLNVEQRRIVELEPAGPMLVKGGEGSGKMTVAICLNLWNWSFSYSSSREKAIETLR